MKGLFVKDLHLLEKQKLFFFATIFLTVMNAYNLQTLVIVPLFTLFFVLSIIFTTITLDEMNHGFSFLFTLPISRKKYVFQKYLLSYISSLAAILLSVVIVLIMNMAQGRMLDMKSFGIVLVGVFIVGSLYISLILPFYFKFDEGKSRLIIMVVMAIIFFFVFLGKGLFERLGIDIMALLLRISATPLWLLFTGGTLTAVIACGISVVFSFRFLEQKEL
ncbi:ABC-2 transporter permease [Enterococcus raffinosus]|uniref:ABC-2 transporter permease n=1 Tax=Enterococcus raffinosus TaxID=71452 RepID=UPI001C111182|nr:ABC-2 transporter permease [Enterococcus raffinosus]MBU5363064.1 ABC-2 transporter permease [Enterococcus raffinosus]